MRSADLLPLLEREAIVHEENERIGLGERLRVDDFDHRVTRAGEARFERSALAKSIGSRPALVVVCPHPCGGCN